MTQPRLSFLLKTHKGSKGEKLYITVYEKTHAETCLQDLEKSRHLLSGPEYEERRRDILKDVTHLHDFFRMEHLLSDVESKEIFEGLSGPEYEERRQDILKDVTHLHDLFRMKYLLSDLEWKEKAQDIITDLYGDVREIVGSPYFRAPRVVADEKVTSIYEQSTSVESDSPVVSILMNEKWGNHSIDRSSAAPSLQQKFEGGEFAWTSLLDEIDARLKCSNTPRVIFRILSGLGVAYVCVVVSLVALASDQTLTDQTLNIMIGVVGLVLFVALIIWALWLQHKTKTMRAKIQKGKQTKIT